MSQNIRNIAVDALARSTTDTLPEFWHTLAAQSMVLYMECVRREEKRSLYAHDPRRLDVPDNEFAQHMALLSKHPFSYIKGRQLMGDEEFKRYGREMEAVASAHMGRAA